MEESIYDAVILLRTVKDKSEARILSNGLFFSRLNSNFLNRTLLKKTLKPDTCTRESVTDLGSLPTDT